MFASPNRLLGARLLARESTSNIEQMDAGGMGQNRDHKMQKKMNPV